MGALWGIAVIGMTAVLLIVVLRRVRLLGRGSGRMIATGVVIGLALVGVGLLANTG